MAESIPDGDGGLDRREDPGEGGLASSFPSSSVSSSSGTARSSPTTLLIDPLLLCPVQPLGPPEWRIVLVGQTGNGKSATGNTILGRQAFEVGRSHFSTTVICERQETQLEGRKVVVMDTPGFFDREIHEQIISLEMNRCLRSCSPGPHIILQVIGLGRLTPEEKMVARLMKEILSLNARNYMILLFTRKDDLYGYPLEKLLSNGDPSLWHQVWECGHRYLAFNNRAEGVEREAQVAQLMAMIEKLVEKNREAPCYTEAMLVADRETLRRTPEFSWLCSLL